jgi:hypothetical protein
MFQHMHIINLYMSYVQPYLKNVQRLQFDDKMRDSPDIIAAFEGSMIEVEILGQFLPRGNKKVWDCFDLHFTFRTKPSLNYQAEGYNRGPIHEGQADIIYRTYAWTQSQINSYLRMRDKEDFDLIKVIDKNLEFAMEELGEELFDYLDEAEKTMQTKHSKSGYVPYHEALGIKRKKKAESSKKAKKNNPDPFTALISGFKELGAAFSTKKPTAEQKDDSGEAKTDYNEGLKPFDRKKENGNAAGLSSAKSWLAYKNYKKANKMITW